MAATDIALISDEGTVKCAECQANWHVPLIADAHANSRLRSMGFAFIWFDDDAICINHFPHCELPIATTSGGTWPISPLFH
jgi:hypothetical protein